MTEFEAEIDSLSTSTPVSGCTSLDVAKTLYKIPALLTTWTRCGKPQCRCTAGHLHGPYHALHWREGSVQRRCYVRAADVPAVQAVLEGRREARSMERLALMHSMYTWRILAQLAEDSEARIHDHQGSA